MLKSVIVAAGLMAGSVFLASAASASEIDAALAPEAADMIQPAHFGWGGYGGYGRHRHGGYGYRGHWRPSYGWGGGHRHHHHGWGGGWGRGYGYGYGRRGYF